MPNAFSQFLENDYSSHFGVTWNPTVMALRVETPASVAFEIQDKQVSIVQATGHGVSVIRRSAMRAEVLDFEDFCNVVHAGNIPRACDFIISPEAGYDYIVLNELTYTKSCYIKSFIQPTTGEEQTGKLEYAKQQLLATIRRIYNVSNFLDNYVKKTALFSCRLSDKSGNGPMARSARAFNSTISALEHMRLHDTLDHGFVFEMRVYNQEYKL